MRISYFYRGAEQHGVFGGQALIGRPKAGFVPDLDLTPDQRVSRPHARIWEENGQYWIEDLDSASGTKVNGEEIKGEGKRRLHGGDSILIGKTTLQVEIPQPDELMSLSRTISGPDSSALDEQHTWLDATRPAYLSTDTHTPDSRRQALLYELPLQFGSETNLDALLQLITRRVVEAIPGAERGALLLGQKLLLQACHPHNFRPSITFARMALEQRQALIWPPTPDVHGDVVAPGQHTTDTLKTVKSAMYVPLLWKDQALGVVCVDSCKVASAFSPEDLRLLLAVAHHGAMALATYQLQEELRLNTQVLERLLTNFSPKIRKKLLHEAHQGRFRPGGKKSEVTVLCSDIRKFTAISAGMDVDDIVKMLNDYFAVLIECIFKYEGTIDKFIGDAILAVFGSPEPVESSEEKAVQAALEMQTAVAELNRRRAASGEVTCEIGIGVHCGEVIHGFIGTAERMEFTIIGDAVNRVSRYCDGARDGEILLSPEMRARLWHSFRLEDISFQDKHGKNLMAYRVPVPI